MALNSLPVLGAALTLESLDSHRDWILDKQRDVEIQSFVSADVLEGDWSGRAAEVRKKLDGHTGRLGIHGPFWGFKIDTPDPDVRAIAKKRFMQGLDVCAAIGATQMVIHSPYTTWDYNNLDATPGARAMVTERCHAVLRDVVKRAESQGCTLVIENVEDKDPMTRLELARSFDSPAVRLSIDTGHAFYAHVTTGAPPVDYYVTAAGDMLSHVHVQDADGYADRHWAPGDGDINWSSLFVALGKVSSEPRLVIELKDHSAIRRGAGHLAALGIAV